MGSGSNLHWMLRSYLEGHPIGEVFYAPFDVVFSDFDVVEPDLLYISRERGRGPDVEACEGNAGSRH